MANENVVELSDSTFENVLSSATEPMLVDFWSTSCAPCRMLGPIIDEIANENVGKFKIAKANFADAPMAFEKFGVRGVPTLLYLKAGEKVDQTVGVSGKAEIIRRLEALV